jgi:hypothetical protein
MGVTAYLRDMSFQGFRPEQPRADGACANGSLHRPTKDRVDAFSPRADRIRVHFSYLLQRG